MPTDRIVIGTEAILELAVIVDPSALDDHTSIIGGVSQALYGEGTGSHLLGGRISIAPLGTYSLPAGGYLATDQVEHSVIAYNQTGTGESSAASASHGVVSLHLIGVAGSGNNGTPVNHGLTGLAVGSAGVACGIAGSGNCGKSGQLSIMVVPRIYVIVDLGCNGNSAAEGIGGIIRISDLSVNHVTINGYNGAIAGLELGLGRNGFVGYMVDTVPSPQTNGNADQGGCGIIESSTVSLNGNSQVTLYLVELIADLEAICHNGTLGFPSVSCLQLQSCGQLVDVTDVSSIDINVINRTILRHIARVIMTGQHYGRGAGNGKGSGYLGGVTQVILDFKANGVNTGSQGHVLTDQILAGNGHVGKFNAIDQDLASSIVQLDIISNGCGESHCVAVDRCILIQLYGFVSGGVADVADRRQYSVIHSGAIVQRKVIIVEGQVGSRVGLHVEADKGRLTAVCSKGRVGGEEITELSEIYSGIDPTGFGNISLSTGVQVLDSTADSSEHEVSAGTACAVGIFEALKLHSQTCGTLGNVDPHAESGGVLTIGYIAENDGITNVEEHIVRPARKLRVGIIQGYAQRILAVSDNVAGQESGGVSIVRIVTVALNRSGSTDLFSPVVHLVHTQEVGNIAILKVKNNFGTLTVGHLQNVGHCGIGLISGSYVNTGDTFVGSSHQGCTVQGSGGIIGQCQGISTIHANSPVVSTVGAGEVKGHALAVGEYSFILSKCEDVGINHGNVSLTHYLVIVNQLDLGHALLAGGHELAGLDGTEGSVSHLPGSTLGNGSGSVSRINTGCGELQGRAGSHVIIVSVQNSFVELAGSLDLGNQDHAVDGRTLGAVGGDRTHDVIGIAGALGNEGGGSAAVAVNCVHATQSQHHLTHLVVGKTAGGGGVTTVNLTEDQGTVSLDTDHGAGSVGRCTLNSFGLKYAVLNQPTEVSGNGSLLIAGQRGAHGTKLTTTVLVDGQVGLCALMNFRSAENHAVPNHVTIGSVGVVSQGGIHSTDHVVAQGLIVSHGLGQLHSLPVLGLISNAFQGQIVGIQLVNAVVTGQDLDHLVGRVYLKGVNDLTVITGVVVEDHLYLGDAGGELIDLFGNFFKIVVGYRCVIIPRGGQSREGHHGDTQQYC